MFGDIGKMASMLKNLQGMKANMEKMKNELAKREYSAMSANTGVQAVVSGELVVRKITIAPELLNSGNAELVQQAVTEAVNSAMMSAKLDAAAQLSQATGGMDIPGLS